MYDLTFMAFICIRVYGIYMPAILPIQSLLQLHLRVYSTSSNAVFMDITFNIEMEERAPLNDFSLC